MKEIFHEYGTTVISVIVALLLFFLVFGKLSWKENRGLLDILGAGARIEKNSFSEYRDSKETIEALEEKRPVISWQNVTIKTGNIFHEDALFQANDAKGNPAETEVLQVLGPTGNEVSKTDGKIYFDRQGIYQFRVRAIDENCGITEELFFIPVVCR